MVIWTIVGALYGAALLALWLLGGLAAAGAALREWGCASGAVGSTRCN